MRRVLTLLGTVALVATNVGVIQNDLISPLVLAMKAMTSSESSPLINPAPNTPVTGNNSPSFSLSTQGQNGNNNFTLNNYTQASPYEWSRLSRQQISDLAGKLKTIGDPKPLKIQHDDNAPGAAELESDLVLAFTAAGWPVSYSPPDSHNSLDWKLSGIYITPNTQGIVLRKIVEDALSTSIHDLTSQDESITDSTPLRLYIGKKE
jgi:hypothetical protein